MSQRIIYTAADGNMCVIVPAPEAQWTDVMKTIPNGVDYEVVDVSEVPSDRTFRNAWVHAKGQSNKVGVDLPKAKEIVHTKRRERRQIELAPLDQLININVAKPQTVATIEAQRQVIRDKYAKIQIDIDSAPGVPELKLIIEGL